MIRQTKKFGLLIIQVAALFLLVASFGLWSIYQTTLRDEKAELEAIASRNSSLIKVIAKKYDRQELLDILRAAYFNAQTPNKGEELWIAEKRNDQLVCLGIYSWHGRTCFQPLEVPSHWAIPMRKALKGESGTIISLDYQGVKVVAAYQAIPELGWGLIVKRDLATIQAPFWWLEVVIVLLTTGIAAMGLAAYVRGNSLLINAWNYVIEKNKFLQELQQERNFIINVLEYTDNLIVVLDTEFNIILFNKASENITHYASEEVIGKNFRDIFIIPEEKAEITRILNALDEQQKTISHVNYWLTKEQEKRLISWRNTPVFSERGGVRYFIKNGVDITEKILIEKALLESQAQFKTMFEKANVGMALLDLEGKITVSNKELQYILYYSESELIEKPFVDLIYCQENGDFTTFYQGFLQGDRDYFQMEVTCLSQDKQIIWVQLVVSAVRTDENQFKFAVAMIEDISLRKEAEKVKAELMARNQSLVAALGQVVYRHNLISSFMEWDGNYSEILGYSLEELGQNSEFWLQHIHPQDYPLVLEEMKRVIAEKRLLDIEYRFQNQDGSYHWFHDRGVLIMEGEQAQTIIGVMLDITERKNLEEQRLNAEKQYKQLLETTTEGVWLIDSLGKTLFVNETMAAMLGYSMSEMLDKTIFNCISPEDIAIAQEHLERRRQGVSENHEFRLVRKDGIEIWVLIATSPIKNEENKVVGALGMITDITEQKRMQFALKMSNEKLNETIQQLEEYNQDMMLLNELHDFLQSCKTVQEAYQILANSLQSLFPYCSFNLFRINITNQSVEMAIAGGKAHTKLNFEISECWGLLRGSPHYLSGNNSSVHCEHLLESSDLVESLCIPLITEGKQLGLLFIGTEMSNGLTVAKQQIAKTLAENIALTIGNLELREILEFQSIHDSLTGLYNRHYWEKALSREIKLAERRGSFLSVIMVDVDHFKRFNDSFSHQVGDSVLKEISQILSQNCRSTDIICRYGGEEFLLILPDSNLEDASKRAEDLRLAVKELELYSGEKYLGQLTASFGVAGYPESVKTGYDLTIVADHALLQAKKAGRDRVITYQLPINLRI